MTKEELRAKANQTRLKNLLIRQAKNDPLTKADKTQLKRLLAQDQSSSSGNLSPGMRG